MTRRCFAIAAALIASALVPGAFASAEELVKFHVAVPRGQADADAESIRGYLTRPNGAGPFPAVVLLHSCLGLPADRRSIGAAIAGWGYVALFVDDFTTRGLKETCAVDFPQGLSDAFGALSFLSTLSSVDARRIAAIGWSQGADVALGIAASPSGAGFAIAGGPKFTAAAAIYPPCANRSNARLQIATLILVGGADTVTPAADCERLAERQTGDPPGVRLVVYPGADHGFDNREFTGGKRLLGMWLKYDRQAAERSRAELRDFLASKLSR